MTFRITALLAACATFAMARVTTPETIPEPSTLILMGARLAGMAIYASKRFKR